jgi:serine/threonine protein kinase
MLARDTVLQNRYRVIRQFGQGGMGTVYEAVDERLDTIVALKESHFTDERLRKQFEREARLLARLRHPAMTRVIDHFTEGEGQFLVMDFVAGDDLWEMMQRRGGAFPLADVLTWADQLLDALDYLHRQDPPIIHRDIKPQNLKLSDTGQIILLDFGLAKGFAGQISRVTTSGSIFGYTPNYAPLEQIQGTGTEPRSDLYSLAATLYHLSTGAMPPDVLTRLTATTEGQPDPLHLTHEVSPEVSSSLAEVLSHGMAIARTQRFATAAEMRKALHNVRGLVERISSSERETLSPTAIDHKQASRVREQIIQDIPPTVASPDEGNQSLVEDASDNIEEEDDLWQPVRKKNWAVWFMLSLIALIIIFFLVTLSGRPS